MIKMARFQESIFAPPQKGLENWGFRAKAFSESSSQRRGARSPSPTESDLEASGDLTPEA